MGKLLHASGSGYFPYCIQESSDSRNAIWSLENAMKIYWRVRSWSFSASGTLLFEGETFPFSTSLSNIQSGSFWDDIYTTEEQLVCGGGFYLNDPSNSDQFVQIEFDTVKKANDLYNAGLNGYVYDLFAGVEYSFVSPVPSYTAKLSTISFCGGTLPIGAGRLEGEQTVTIESLNTASLTPTSWWSYGGKYDTSTGAPL